jgi:hypothetical protein
MRSFSLTFLAHRRLPPVPKLGLTSGIHCFADVLDSVPGLTANVVAFAVQHRGQVHDIFILMQFATSMAQVGRVTQALNLFGSVLRLERERPVQIAVLKRCLEYCWRADRHETGASKHGSGVDFCQRDRALGPSQRVEQRAPDKAGAREGQVEAMERHRTWDVTDELAGNSGWSAVNVAQFVEAQQGLEASDFVQILGGLGVPRTALLDLCKELIAPSAGRARGGGVDDQQQMQASLGLVPMMFDLLAEGLVGPGDASVCGQLGGMPSSQGLQDKWRPKLQRDPIRYRLLARKILAFGGLLAGLVVPGAAGRMLSTAPVIWLVSKV